MKNIASIILVMLLLNFNVYSQTNNDSTQSKIYLIFIEKYEKDTVSLWIDQCQIIKDAVISSAPYGVTNLEMAILAPNKLFFNESSLEVPCSFEFKPIMDFYVSINGKKQLLKVDIKKGAYIGIDNNENKLSIIQSKEPFEFE